jgi:hypothetical protein
MTLEEKIKFLNNIQEEVKKDTSLFADIVMACNSSINEAIQAEREHAADMETITAGLYSLVNSRYKEKNQQWFLGLIKSKLEKWSEKSYLGGWEQVLEDLKNK